MPQTAAHRALLLLQGRRREGLLLPKGWKLYSYSQFTHKYAYCQEDIATANGEAVIFRRNVISAGWRL